MLRQHNRDNDNVHISPKGYKTSQANNVKLQNMMEDAVKKECAIV